MRRFMVHLVTVTEVEFEDGDEASDKTVQNYQKQLSETVRNAAQGLLLRTVKGARIVMRSVSKSLSPLEPAPLAIDIDKTLIRWVIASLQRFHHLTAQYFSRAGPWTQAPQLACPRGPNRSQSGRKSNRRSLRG
jgi:hypothetical protein